MPHKMNMRTSERISGFTVILSGYVTMATGLAGHQWNEGDVSDSVVRRVMLPDAFFAADGLFEAFLTVLNEFGQLSLAASKPSSQAELPFLTTTKLLVPAVKGGYGSGSGARADQDPHARRRHGPTRRHRLRRLGPVWAKIRRSPSAAIRSPPPLANQADH